MSSDALRGALQSMAVSEPSAIPLSARLPAASLAAPEATPHQRLRVDPVIVDAMAAAVFDGVSPAAGAGTTKIATTAINTERDTLKDDIRKELRRLAVLKSYRVIGSSSQNPAYERLISLTSRVFKVPMAYISVIDSDKQHYLASRGLGLGGPFTPSMPRSNSICAHALSSDEDLMIIPDLTKSPQFCTHEMVKDVPYLRFYASAPLLCPEKYQLGTLCILDTEPRPGGLSFDMKQNLREIADMVMDVMVEEVCLDWLFAQACFTLLTAFTHLLTCLCTLSLTTNIARTKEF